MKRKLEIEIIFDDSVTFNINKIKAEIIKLWLKADVIQKDENICLIELKTFEISFWLWIMDLISHILVKSKLKSVKKVNYNLEYFSNYEHILYYFLLDFDITNDEKEAIKDIFLKIMETPTYLNKDLFEKWFVMLKNKNVINLDSLRKIFYLDKKILYINNSALKEKLMRFILDMRSRVGSYIFI